MSYLYSYVSYSGDFWIYAYKRHCPKAYEAQDHSSSVGLSPNSEIVKPINKSLFTNVLTGFFCSYPICYRRRHDTFYLNFYRFHRNYQTRSDTKKKGTRSIRTPWRYSDLDAGLIFEVPTLTHGFWSSVSNSVHDPSYAHTQVFKHRQISFMKIVAALIGKLRTRVSITRSTQVDHLQVLTDLPFHQTIHRAWSLGFYSYSVLFSSMVIDLSCSCFTGH